MVCQIYFTPNKSQSARSYANSDIIYTFLGIFNIFLNIPLEIRVSPVVSAIH